MLQFFSTKQIVPLSKLASTINVFFLWNKNKYIALLNYCFSAFQAEFFILIMSDNGIARRTLRLNDARGVIEPENVEELR